MDDSLDGVSEILKEEALDRLLWRTRYGRGDGPSLDRMRDTDIVL